MSTFTPSPEQLAFFTALRAAERNLMLVAVAGSGKTTTLVEGLKVLPVRNPETFLPPSVCFLAFNKSIAETLRARVPRHVSCRTFHSLGLAAGKDAGLWPTRLDPDGRKVPRLVFARMDRENPDAAGVIRLVSLLKNTWPTATRSVAEEILLHHDFDFERPEAAVRIALEVLEQSDKDLSSIDFDDMLRQPLLRGAKFPQQDFVFVDEAQDLNSIQHEMLSRLGQPQAGKTVFVFVGDPAQAIYGFRGAAADSMPTLARRFSCEILPLSVSFRCPRAVVAEAQKYYHSPL